MAEEEPTHLLGNLGRVRLHKLLRLGDDRLNLSGLELLVSPQLRKLLQHRALHFTEEETDYVLRLGFHILLHLVQVRVQLGLNRVDVPDSSLPTSHSTSAYPHFRSQLLVVNARAEVLVHSVELGQLVIQMLEIETNVVDGCRHLICARSSGLRTTR